MSALNIENRILNKVKKAKMGSLYFADSFADYGTPKAVAKALERLTQSGELMRVARGMYTRPVKDPVLGVVMPTLENIAQAIGKRDKATLIPTGSLALYKLGLTTQVPLNVVYYTSASPRSIVVNNRIIKFKKTTAKNLAYIGETSKLVIVALKEIGKDKVTPDQLEVLEKHMRNEKAYHARHDLNNAPAWIRTLFSSLRNTLTHE
jgi:predicted transcriptional regulator of viral defense system